MRVFVLPLVLLLLLFPVGLAECPPNHLQWGTLRPQSLISVRAAVPHSPFFGFMYHPANSLAIRHMSTDDKISSFSWSRHDGRSFGDQLIVDHDLNLRIHTSFQKHPHKNAWALRVSAEQIDSAKKGTTVSMAFYAMAGPDDILDQSGVKDHQEWGKIGLSEGIQLTDEGIMDDVVLDGHAASVGGKFRVTVKEPIIGAVDKLSLEDTESPRTAGLTGGMGSRSLLRNRGDKVDIEFLPLDSFHVTSMGGDPRLGWAVENNLKKSLKKRKRKGGEESAVYLLQDEVEGNGRGMLVQRVLQAPFQMEAIFVMTEEIEGDQVGNVEKDLCGDRLEELLEKSRMDFDGKFDKVFGLKEKGLSEQKIAFGKAALSNVLGGIGFFYGSSLAPKTSHGESSADNVRALKPVALLSATPSRALFPRGFLWDEGFHQLIVQRWDPELSRRCMRSWMNTMQESGWIPREQILGLEARNRFPEHIRHLMVQNPIAANPPTILMPLRYFASASSSAFVLNENESTNCPDEFRGHGDFSSGPQTSQDFSRDILDQVEKYYRWLRKTQSGEMENSFRWRGRSSDIKAPDGYPLTLASGLDDYPRAEVPSLKERHVDLHCWMTWASGVLATLSESAGRDSSSLWEEHMELRLSLINLHGSSDVDSSERSDRLLCDYDGDEKICHEGYVTILPLILGLLDASDVRVGTILESLENPDLLRARAGVRSLSKQNKWHRKGDDYWTGSVWMPFNFLTLAALKAKYSVEEGPYRARAKTVFNELRKSILDNAFEVFSETGQLWENYSPDDDGAGKSGRQFTGWSALVLLMYADMFDGVT